MKFFNKINKWALFYSILAFVLVLLAFYPKSIISFRYDSDFARDITEIFDITQGEMRLTGPKLSFGGIYTGPYYYYLFAPIMTVVQNKPEMMIYFNLLIFAVGGGVITFILSQYQADEKSPLGLLMTAWLMTSTYYVFSSKNPGNAFSYLPLLSIILVSFPMLAKTKKNIFWLMWGFLYGIVVKNPFSNSFLLIRHFGNWYQPNFWWLLIPVIGLSIYLVYKKKIKASAVFFQVIFASLLAFLILAIVARSQLAFHYFFPFILLTQIGFVLLIFKLKNSTATLLTSTLIVINILFWPKQFFTNSNRLIDNYRHTTQLIVEDQDFTQKISSATFNIFVIRETPLAISGWEYRYFLKSTVREIKDFRC